MQPAKAPSKWPYRAGRPARRTRVLKTGEATPPLGVRRPAQQAPRYQITRLQARVAFSVLAASIAIWSGWSLYHSRWLTVHELRVSGIERLSPETVRATASLDGDSIFRLDLEAAEARLEALAEVRSATVTKGGLNVVSINLEERRTWGAWQVDGERVAVDIDGLVLEGTPPDGLPVIIAADGPRVPAPGDRLDAGAIALADRLVREADRTLGTQVQLLVYRQEAGLTAVLGSDRDGEDRFWVTFGDSRDYDYKVAALYGLMERAAEQDIKLHAVDLRFGDRLSFN